MTSHIVTVMEQIAHRTWTDIVDGDLRGLRLTEDSISEYNLLEMDRRVPDLHVKRFNRHEESKNGADWEWWIGEGPSWMCLRIQAKRVDGRTYRQLDHHGVRDGDFQYDTLIREAQIPGIHPLYVFFNGFDDWPTGAPWNGCPAGVTVLGDCAHGPESRFGCAVAQARTIKWLHAGGGPRRNDAEPYLAHSRPWSCCLTATLM